MRIVVCALGGAYTPWALPASEFGGRPFIRGGERSLYEIAFAATAAGHDVELRGSLLRDVFDPLSHESGVEPRTDFPQRAPDSDDMVIVPEAWPPQQLARVVLSPARAVMVMLAPPGLFGWPFDASEEPLPDPLTVPLDAVGRAESFRAASALGFELWTNSAGTQASSHDAGVPCTNVGTGQPREFPQPPGKAYDIATVEQNRWAPLASDVVAGLRGVTHLPIGEVPHPQMLASLGSARILIWPSRIEGHSRIQVEARAMGCIPVALSSNRFAGGLDDAGGAVLVDSIEQMPGAVRALLADEHRLKELSERAMRTARAQVEWQPFIGRVDAAIRAAAPDKRPEGGALARLGAEIEPFFRRATHTDVLEDVLARVGAEAQQREKRIAALEEKAATVRHEADASATEARKLRAELDAARNELAVLRSEFDALRSRTAVRFVLGVDDITRTLRPRKP